MPRDPNGEYELPAGNPVISGTLVSSDWANPTMGDLGQEMSDSLSRSGKGGMQAPFRATNGTELAPSMTFVNDIITGRYLFSPGDMRDTLSNSDKLRFTNEGVFVRIDDEWVPINPTLTGRKNLLINGAFDIWQRGTSGFSNEGEYTADRWRIQTGVGEVQRYVWDESQSRQAIYGLRISRGIAGGAAIEHRIESRDAAKVANLPLTFSMYTAQIATGFPSLLTFHLFYANTTDDFSSATLIESIGVNTPTPPVSIEVNFGPMPTEARRGLMLRITATVDGAADWVYSECQLEVGTKATQLERTPVADTLVLCKRYFERFFYVGNSIIAVGQAISEANGNWELKYEEKRATPSVIMTGPIVSLTANGGVAGGVATASVPNLTQVRLSQPGSVGLVAGNAMTIFLDNGDGAIAVNAEL